MRAFALLELLLVIGLIAAAVFLYLPYLRNFQKANDLSLAVEIVSQSIKRAQTRALVAESDSHWGVKIEASRAVVFKGPSFTGRDPSFDETLGFPQMVISGSSEIIFQKVSGEVALGPGQSAHNTSLSNGTNVQTLTISSSGVVQ